MKYIKLPDFLFEEKRYRNLSMGAKLLYCLLADRVSLSVKNGWKDEEGEYFIIFSRREAAEKLDVSYKKAVDCFKELKDANLIFEKKAAKSSIRIIYVLNNVKKGNMGMGEKVSTPSAKNTYTHMQILPIFNNRSKTDISKTYHHPIKKGEDEEDFSHLCEIIEKCNLDIWYDDTGKILKNAIEKLYFTENLKVDGKVVNNNYIRNKLSELTEDSVIFAVDKMRSYEQPVKNPERYLFYSLIKAPDEYAAEQLINSRLVRAY